MAYKPRNQLTPEERKALDEKLKQPLPPIYDVFHVGDLDDRFCDRVFRPKREERNKGKCPCIREYEEDLIVPGNLYITGSITTDYFRQIKTYGGLYVTGVVNLNCTYISVKGDCVIKGWSARFSSIDVQGNLSCNQIPGFRHISVSGNFTAHDLVLDISYPDIHTSISVNGNMEFFRSRKPTHYTCGGMLSAYELTVGGNFCAHTADHLVSVTVIKVNGSFTSFGEVSGYSIWVGRELHINPELCDWEIAPEKGQLYPPKKGEG